VWGDITTIADFYQKSKRKSASCDVHEPRWRVLPHTMQALSPLVSVCLSHFRAVPVLYLLETLILDLVSDESQELPVAD
jgi:hypothetical protein